MKPPAVSPQQLRAMLKRLHLACVRPQLLVCDEVGYLAHGPDAANVLFHVVDECHRRRRPMVFTTNKPLEQWGRVLHDPDLAEAILDRILERGRIVTLEGPSMRTRHRDMPKSCVCRVQAARLTT